MIEQNVQVVRCRDDRMWVRMGSQSGCTACDNGNGCGAGVFAKLLQNKPVVMELERNDVQIQPGQMLTLGFPEQVYLKLVFTYYGWPLLAALIGAFATFRMGEWATLSAGWLDLATLAGGLVSGALLLHKLKKHQNTGAFLKSLQTTVYIPSVAPNMCNTEVNQHQN
jgi:sigma-E factor negative regulatory protein RseC